MMQRSNRFIALALVAGLAISAPSAWAQEHGGGGHPGGAGAHPGGGGGHPSGGAHPGAGARPGGGNAHAGGGARPGGGAHPAGNAHAAGNAHPGGGARPGAQGRPGTNHRYNAGAYHGPRGYAYHRWSNGNVMPRAYWGRQYWLTNFALYGLSIPPAGFQWVRYGPDAVLINTYNGQVVQVIYGRFL